VSAAFLLAARWRRYSGPCVRAEGFWLDPHTKSNEVAHAVPLERAVSIQRLRDRLAPLLRAGWRYRGARVAERTDAAVSIETMIDPAPGCREPHLCSLECAERRQARRDGIEAAPCR
jgi:hypothetical protein